MIAKGGKSAWFYPATAVLEARSFQQMGRLIEWQTLTAIGSIRSVIGIGFAGRSAVWSSGHDLR